MFVCVGDDGDDGDDNDEVSMEVMMTTTGGFTPLSPFPFQGYRDRSYLLSYWDRTGVHAGKARGTRRNLNKEEDLKWNKGNDRHKTRKEGEASTGKTKLTGGIGMEGQIEEKV